MFRRSCRETQTHILCSITLVKNRALYEIMQKNLVQSNRLEMTILYGACALRVEKVRLQTRTYNMQQLKFSHCKILYSNGLQYYVIQGESLARGPKLLSIKKC